MPVQSHDFRATRVFEYADDAPVLRKVQDALDLIGDARGQSATLAIIPIHRLDPTFFQLCTGLAGEMLQKFVTYGLRLAILGNFQELASQSTALRDFIRESNRGSAIWFLANRKELEERFRA
ncbi:MAG: DUF4180 domain-containing protein [Terracidiphilus sp.]|jgi:hypothetical protein